MTACALYIRKSNDQTDIAADAKSVARQREHGTAYAARKGWTVDRAHVYEDDGISGAVFGAGRPGLARLLNALTSKPAFQALVMMEETRLGRESVETSWVAKQILDAGVRIFFYLTDTERTLNNATDKVMLALSNFASEMERERIAARTHDGMVRKARAGYATGGKVFGYRSRPVMVGDKHSHVEREVNPAQAQVVRRIFRLASDGHGVRRIMAMLNAERVPGPGGTTWSASTVRRVLDQTLYRGVARWNRRKGIIRQGREAFTPRPEAEWVTVARPDLRIVSDAVWEAAHARLAASRACYTGDKTTTNPRESRYLLSGVLRCSACGGRLFANRRGPGSVSYVCSRRHACGEAGCTNATRLPLSAFEDALRRALENSFRREVVETALDTFLAQRETREDGHEDQASALRGELAALDGQAARLTAAIARGGDLPSLVDALAECERQRATIRGALADRARRPTARPTFDRVGALALFRNQWAECQRHLRGKTPQARRMLLAVLPGCLVVTPTGPGVWRFEGEGLLAPLFQGVFSSVATGSPRRPPSVCDARSVA